MKRDALFNMIEQQIRPWDVLNLDVLNALRELPRAGFVPPSHRAFAYTDTELPLHIDGVDTGTHLLAPRLIARLVQSLDVQPHESVAQVGLGDGYLTALLARFAKIVTVYERDERVLKFAQNNLNQHGIRNVNYELGDGLKRSTDKFDALILGGSVPALSDAVKHKVNVGGRILAIIGQADAPVMQAVMTERTTEQTWQAQTLFETVAPALESEASETTRFIF
jgi:protein-L-isoaspartate(D-aspartate) O-methyltransferase